MEQQKSGSAKINSGKIALWIVAIIIIVALIWLFASLAGHQAGTASETSPTGVVTSTGFTSQVPQNVALTTPTASSTLMDSGTKAVGGLEMFTIKAENGTFTPSQIVIQKGDQIQLSFEAVDGTYDFMFTSPIIGFDLVTKKGETKVFGFNSADKPTGVYSFGCQKYCGPNATTNASSTEPTVLGTMVIK